ncbi:uncharacterized protein LOC143918961 [Arctopsyche grandis]|uniref:uncharacterized protein LOC143918961 n=1 Tax=Arctopsyche grandis TaxID=121162 RepID=UPI00406D7681
MSKSMSLILLTILVSSSIHLADAYTTHSREEVEDRPEQVPQWHNHRQHHASSRHAVKHQDQLEDNAEEAPHDPTKLRILKRRHVRRGQNLPVTEDDVVRNIFGSPQQQAWMQNQGPRPSEISKRQANYQPNQPISSPIFHQANNVPGSQISNHIYPNSGYNNGGYGGYSGYSGYGAYGAYGAFGSFGLPLGIGFIPIYVQVPCNQNLQPDYLPPNPQRPDSNGTVPNQFPNRIGEDEDDPPSWGAVDNNGIDTPERPTNGVPTLQVDFDRDYFNTATGISLQPVAPLRPNSRPPPSIFHGTNAKPEETPVGSPGNQRPSQSRPQAQIPQAQRPQAPRPQQRPNRPPPPTQNANQPGRDTTNPLNCAYAVVSCCNNSNVRSRSECFTLRGCPGPFFDNPCTSELAKAASDFVIRFPTGQ